MIDELTAPATNSLGIVNKALIVTRIGHKSLHENWLNESREFDVAFSCYDTNRNEISGHGIDFEYRPGFKVAGFDGFLKDREALWKQYEHVCFLDEDLLADTEVLNRMFRLCRKHNLKIAQPALTQDSHFTFGGLLQQPKWLLRHVNYIEMMCPIFRRDVLEVVGPLYSTGYESGIDLIWCNLVAESPRDFAVLDSCPIKHTEPVGERKAENGFTAGRSYEDDIFACLERFGLPWLSCTPFEAIDLKGRRTTSRRQLFLGALSLLRAIPAQKPMRPRIKPVFDHIRHILTRPAKNIKILWPI
jgi:hypothetical protein